MQVPCSRPQWKLLSPPMAEASRSVQCCMCDNVIIFNKLQSKGCARRVAYLLLSYICLIGTLTIVFDMA